MEWERSTFDADGLTGERLTLRDNKGFTVGCIILWPGRMTRIFWPGGRTTDINRRDGRSLAVQAVEKAAGI